MAKSRFDNAFEGETTVMHDNNITFNFNFINEIY